MIIRQDHLEGIRQGRISLAYRKWRKPAVKKGTLMLTAIGRVEILDIVPISIEEIHEKDAIAAGQSLRDLKAMLNAVEEGQIYRIGLRYHSPDPRLELCSRTSLSGDDFSILRKKLQRLDSHSPDGEWTLKTMTIIQENPRVRAQVLAERMGREREAFKVNVRKLKNLGLTISHEIGYSLSPLGERFLSGLNQLDDEASDLIIV